MSADNGYILRKTAEGKFALQSYFASADDFPDVADATMVFDTLEEAVLTYEIIESKMAEVGAYLEYGLTVRTKLP